MINTAATIVGMIYIILGAFMCCGGVASWSTTDKARRWAAAEVIAIGALNMFVGTFMIAVSRSLP